MDVKLGDWWKINTQKKSKHSKTELVSFADKSENAIHTSDLYTKLKLLKLNDLVTLKNILFIHDYFNKNLPESFKNYFQLSKDMHGHSTRNAYPVISLYLKSNPLNKDANLLS